MTGWLIALCVLICIALLPLIPVGLIVVYGKDGLHLFFHIGFLKIPIDTFSGCKKEEKTEKSQSGLKKITSRAKEVITDQEGGKLSEFIPLLDACLKLLGDLRRKIYVKNLSLNLILGGEDACQLALNYGRAWAAVGNLMPLLEQILNIKKRDVQVNCDFTSASTKIYTRIHISIILWRFIHLLVKYGMPVYREYQKIINNNEGGAEE